MSETILVIEDDADIQFNLRLLLEGEGYRVEAAADGAQGLELLRRRGTEFGAALLDLMMPRMSGTEVLEALRDEPGHLPPVIVLSASRDARAVAERFGVEVIAKPIDIDQLLAALTRHCR